MSRLEVPLPGAEIGEGGCGARALAMEARRVKIGSRAAGALREAAPQSSVGSAGLSSMRSSCTPPSLSISSAKSSG